MCDIFIGFLVANAQILSCKKMYMFKYEREKIFKKVCK